MISILGNLEVSWKRIRKAIFTKIIYFSKLIREPTSKIGLSYYSKIAQTAPKNQ